jgi:hypothetical protein
MLTRLEVDGFKSLRDFSIDLEPLTVLLGPNDAGKSNILEALALSSRLAHARGRAQARARPGARPVSARGYTSRFGDQAKKNEPMERAGDTWLSAHPAWDPLVYDLPEFVRQAGRGEYAPYIPIVELFAARLREASERIDSGQLAPDASNLPSVLAWQSDGGCSRF